MQHDLLSRLRKEQRSSPNPEQHIFRLTRAQEREIIEMSKGLASALLSPSNQPAHIASLFGCPVKIVD